MSVPGYPPPAPLSNDYDFASNYPELTRSARPPRSYPHDPPWVKAHRATQSLKTESLNLHDAQTLMREMGATTVRRKGGFPLIRLASSAERAEGYQYMQTNADGWTGPANVAHADVVATDWEVV